MKYGFGRQSEFYNSQIRASSTIVQLHSNADGRYVGALLINGEDNVEVQSTGEIANHGGKKFKSQMEALDFLNSH